MSNVTYVFPGHPEDHLRAEAGSLYIDLLLAKEFTFHQVYDLTYEFTDIDIDLDFYGSMDIPDELNPLDENIDWVDDVLDAED